MCGISGLLSSSAVSVNTLAAMNTLINHRGPDDEGYVLFSEDRAKCLAGNDTAPGAINAAIPWSPSTNIFTDITDKATLGFGHRRLAIVDLSPFGHQPMCYAGGRYWITYNGEIYNHLELRTELEAAGYDFISHSDTEVILAAYDFWGESCLSRFNGMWAFALYDTKERSLFFARDRFGVKPLYYWISPDGALCFGSEIKQFTVYPGWKACVNGQRAYDFLVWGLTDHTDETLFEGVYQLRPGCSATLDVRVWQGQMAKGRLPVKQWYTLTAQPFTGDFDEAAEQFKDKFTEAVKLRLRADVTVGSCLSGGLDSSSIVCVANQLLREQDAHLLQSTFSACAEVERFDERNWIDEVVRNTGVYAHYVYPSLEKLFTESKLITWHQDEPYASSSIYAQWNVFRLAADNDVKVMLDGQGADEQLAGYHAFFAPSFAKLLCSGKWLKLWQDMQSTKRQHGYSLGRLMESVVNLLLPKGLKDILRRATGRENAAPAWLDMLSLGVVANDPFAQFGGARNTIQSLSLAQLTVTNLQMLLHWEDRNSMAHSIESRVPFLDYRLVEFVLGLPDEYKLSNGVTKRVQRAGMSGILPDTIRDRKDKLGFVTPEEVWVKQQAPDLFRARLDSAIKSSHGILKPEASKVLEAMISGQQAFNFGVWRMISFSEWLERFSVEAKGDL
jgi:asparagine synthase (glutamine-hydrolysing)